MSDYDEVCARLELWFYDCYHEGHYAKFGEIPVEERRHPRPDVCAILYLHEKLGGEGNAISAAEHDEIYFTWDNLDMLTKEDVLYLTRCGVQYDSHTNSLEMDV